MHRFMICNTQKIIVVLGILWLILPPLLGQADNLQSGPMVGYSNMREVMLWVQTRDSAKVIFRYWEKDTPSVYWKTEEATTQKATAFTARLVADQVQPGKRYGYALFIDGQKVARPYPLEFQTQSLWYYPADPPDFTFVTGCGTFVNEKKYDRPGKPYGGDYHIFNAIYETHPDFMLWLGDNVYLRWADWGSRTGILHRYTHTRSLPEMQPLLGSVHHYAIWDDHDYGPNDSDRSYPYKHFTEEAFKLFWANPNYNVMGDGGITGTFIWQDIQFFLLDNRYFRSPNNRKTGKRIMLGDAQIQWLIDGLSYSRASFKFIAVGGQILNPSAVWETYSTYPEERKKLLNAIEAAGIPGVIFLTGDRHHTVLFRMDRPRSYPLYELSSSPFTSTAHPPMKEEGAFYVPGTLVTERNFALLEVSGPRKDRVLKIRILNKDGKELWQYTLRSGDLK